LPDWANSYSKNTWNNLSSPEKSCKMSLDRSNLFDMDLRTYDAYKINQAREEEIREKELNKNVLKNQW